MMHSGTHISMLKSTVCIYLYNCVRIFIWKYISVCEDVSEFVSTVLWDKLSVEVWFVKDRIFTNSRASYPHLEKEGGASGRLRTHLTQPRRNTPPDWRCANPRTSACYFGCVPTSMVGFATAPPRRG